MSASVPRVSRQVMIAPPPPSETMVGSDWLLAAPHTNVPLAVHAGSTAPDASTCCAYTSTALPRGSRQVTIAPALPSDTTWGVSWLFAASHSSVPLWVHWA